MMIRHPRSRRGQALISMLMALMIIGILSGIYLNGGTAKLPPGAKPWPQQQTDRARSAVCIANRRTAQSQLIMDEIDNYNAAKTPQGMMATQRKLPHCPGDGLYYITGDEQILCTQHIETPKFHEMLGLQ